MIARPEMDSKLTEVDLDARIAGKRELPTMWDVERSIPWFPLLCVGAVLLGAFLPPLLKWLGS